MDAAITACDNAAGGTRLIGPGAPMKLHMGFPDPAAATAIPAERMVEFRRVYAMIEARLRQALGDGEIRWVCSSVSRPCGSVCASSQATGPSPPRSRQSAPLYIVVPAMLSAARIVDATADWCEAPQKP